MLTHSKFHFFWLFAILVIFLASWQIQGQLLLHFDVSWLTFAASKMMAGGNYINYFLETNPPLILYLYMPLVILKKTLGISVVEGVKIYVFLLSGISLALCAHLLKQIFSKADAYLHHALILALAGIFLILPVNEFGQREHLTVILTCPYLFLLSLRLERKSSPAWFLSGLVGVLGGIGFCIKPYFLLPWAMLELYYVYRVKSWNAILKPELLALVSFVGFYLALIFMFHQDYLYQIIPLISQFYYQRYQRSLFKLLSSEESIYTYFTLFFYVIAYRQQFYTQLQKVLLISILGFWLVFIGQRMGWYYHALPFLSSEILLTLALFLPWAREQQFNQREWVLSGIFILSFLGYLLIKIPYISLCTNFFPYSYFLFFIIVLYSLLWINFSFKINGRLLYGMAFILLVNLIFYRYLRVTIFYQHVFLLSSSMFILTYGLVAPATSSSEKCQQILSSLLAVFIFALPVYKMAYTFSYASYYKIMYTQLTEAMKKYAGRKVIYISNASEMAFPNMDYSEQIYSFRFWSLIWLPAMNFPQAAWSYPAYLEDNQEQLKFYLAALLEDFEKAKPDIVFVDVRGKGYYYTPPPDYIRLFSLRKDFRELWKHYHYVETLDSRPLYKLQVYQKKEVSW